MLEVCSVDGTGSDSIEAIAATSMIGTNHARQRNNLDGVAGGGVGWRRGSAPGRGAVALHHADASIRSKMTSQTMADVRNSLLLFLLAGCILLLGGHGGGFIMFGYLMPFRLPIITIPIFVICLLYAFSSVLGNSPWIRFVFAVLFLTHILVINAFAGFNILTLMSSLPVGGLAAFIMVREVQRAPEGDNVSASENKAEPAEVGQGQDRPVP